MPTNEKKTYYFGIILGGDIEVENLEEAKKLLADFVSSCEATSGLEAEFYHIDEVKADGESVRVFDECNSEHMYD